MSARMTPVSLRPGAMRLADWRAIHAGAPAVLDPACRPDVEAGAAAMAAAGTVAVILPGAFYVLKETRKPPIDAFRRRGVPMAVATDLNPGTSPIASLRLCAHMACTFFGMTVPEVLLGMTRHAAAALGRADVGVLEAGRWCDLAIWEVERPAEIVARIGPAPLRARVWRGA